MMKQEHHQIAPDFKIPGVDGKTHSLHEYLGEGHPTLLVFLRHLG